MLVVVVFRSTSPPPTTVARPPPSPPSLTLVASCFLRLTPLPRLRLTASPHASCRLRRPLGGDLEARKIVADMCDQMAAKAPQRPVRVVEEASRHVRRRAIEMADLFKRLVAPPSTAALDYNVNAHLGETTEGVVVPAWRVGAGLDEVLSSWSARSTRHATARKPARPDKAARPRRWLRHRSSSSWRSSY